MSDPHSAAAGTDGGRLTPDPAVYVADRLVFLRKMYPDAVAGYFDLRVLDALLAEVIRQQEEIACFHLAARVVLTALEKADIASDSLTWVRERDMLEQALTALREETGQP